MTTGDAEPVFVDTNVLVFSTVARAPDHAVARLTLDLLWEAAVEMWISRQIIREYLAVLTRPQTFTQPLGVPELVADVRRFSTDFRVAEDSAAVTEELLRILEKVPVGGRRYSSL